MGNGPRFVDVGAFRCHHAWAERFRVSVGVASVSSILSVAFFDRNGRIQLYHREGTRTGSQLLHCMTRVLVDWAPGQVVFGTGDCVIMGNGVAGNARVVDMATGEWREDLNHDGSSAPMITENAIYLEIVNVRCMCECDNCES